ncbi:MAG: hypothetical protein JNM93_13255 [Bacteriovoracaceae bacterium]|nr:hypothetical protein [Bacteriovoracaceae bacterium]
MDEKSFVNVYSLAEVKRKKHEEQAGQYYSNYLKLLNDNELEYEVKALIEGLSNEHLESEMIQRGKLILGEISSRINFSPVKTNSINGMSETLKILSAQRTQAI